MEKKQRWTRTCHLITCHWKVDISMFRFRSTTKSVSLLPQIKGSCLSSTGSNKEKNRSLYLETNSTMKLPCLEVSSFWNNISSVLILFYSRSANSRSPSRDQPVTIFFLLIRLIQIKVRRFIIIA